MGIRSAVESPCARIRAGEVYCAASTVKAGNITAEQPQFVLKDRTTDFKARIDGAIVVLFLEVILRRGVKFSSGIAGAWLSTQTAGGIYKSSGDALIVGV